MAYDHDGSDNLGRDDIRKLLLDLCGSLEIDLQESHITTLIKAMDIDGDGCIDLGEMLELMAPVKDRMEMDLKKREAVEAKALKSGNLEKIAQMKAQILAQRGQGSPKGKIDGTEGKISFAGDFMKKWKSEKTRRQRDLEKVLIKKTIDKTLMDLSGVGGGAVKKDSLLSCKGRKSQRQRVVGSSFIADEEEDKKLGIYGEDTDMINWQGLANANVEIAVPKIINNYEMAKKHKITISQGGADLVFSG
jgi:predicted secreted protein